MQSRLYNKVIGLQIKLADIQQQIEGLAFEIAESEYRRGRDKENRYMQGQIKALKKQFKKEGKL